MKSFQMKAQVLLTAEVFNAAGCAFTKPNSKHLQFGDSKTRLAKVCCATHRQECGGQDAPRWMKKELTRTASWMWLQMAISVS